ncbi:MAG: hypothetical protein ACFBRM_05280 [Pikeienuella sp.]
MPGVNLSALLSKGFDKGFWQKNRHSSAKGSGVGAALNEVRKYCGPDGKMAAKHVAELRKVLEAFRKVTIAIGTAEGKAKKAQAQDTLDLCKLYRKAVAVREDYARGLARDAQNVVAAPVDPKKVIAELKPFMDKIKSYANQAVQLFKDQQTHGAVIEKFIKMKPPTQNDITAAYKSLEALKVVSKAWVEMGKLAKISKPNFDLNKFPEHAKPAVAKYIKEMEAEFKKLSDRLDNAVTANLIASFEDTCGKVAALYYSEVAASAGEKARTINKTLEGFRQTMHNQRKIMDKHMASKASGNDKLDYIEKFISAHDKTIHLTDKLSKEYQKISLLKDMKSWPKNMAGMLNAAGIQGISQVKSSPSKFIDTTKMWTTVMEAAKAHKNNLDIQVEGH